MNNIKHSEDPYNYKSLNRKDLMSLSTITSADVKMKKIKGLETGRDYNNILNSRDIKGCNPTEWGKPRNKPDYIHSNTDIQKSSPKKLIIETNKPDYIYSNLDIYGSYPNINKFNTSRNINPLNPLYKLPSIVEYPDPEPKFIRDNINIDDIEGTKPLKNHNKIISPLNKNSNLDIEGSWSRPLIRTRVKGNISTFDYSDIIPTPLIPKKEINPLEPVYHLRHPDGQKFVYSTVEGSKPSVFSPYRVENPFNLRNNDIEGSEVGSKNRIRKFYSNNTNLKNNDIEGSCSGSLKKGIKTNRVVNNVDPIYDFPGHMEHAVDYGQRIFSQPTTKVKEISSKIKSMRIENNDFYINKEDKFPKENNDCLNNIINTNEKEIINSIVTKTDPSNINSNEIIKNTIKPDPYHGISHDKYLIPSKNNPMKIRLLNLEEKFNMKQKKVNPLSKSSALSETYAEKLDRLISNY